MQEGMAKRETRTQRIARKPAENDVAQFWLYDRHNLKGETMAFRLTISTGGAAFGGEAAPLEVARILRDVVAKLEAGDDFGHYRTLRDINGNDVGRARLRLEGERDD